MDTGYADFPERPGVMPSASAAACLFVLHTGSNIGYSIEPAERVFYKVGVEVAGGNPSDVHFAFRNLDAGPPRSLPAGFKNLLAYDYCNRDPENIRRLADYVQRHRIRLVVIYDIPFIHPLFKHLHKAGARAIISFWGAPIADTSRVPFWEFALWRLRVLLSRSKVDGLIFESNAMVDLAIRGRGVPPRMIDMVHNGVDVSVYRPATSTYVYETLRFPPDRKVVVYAGHMEPRKGLQTLVEAAIVLLHQRKRSDVCFLICGNKGDESKQYERMYAGLGLDTWIRFGGYRSDMARVYPSCFCGVVPTTGWDSFPRSPIEMAASGLPVIAARLQGLAESVLDRETGMLFEAGNATELADCIETLLDRPELAARYGERGRERCEKELDVNTQALRLRQVFLKRLGMA